MENIPYVIHVTFRGKKTALYFVRMKLNRFLSLGSNVFICGQIRENSSMVSHAYLFLYSEGSKIQSRGI
jgi:hypothetical protein